MTARITKCLAKLETSASDQSWFNVPEAILTAIAKLPRKDRHVFQGKQLYEVSCEHPDVWERFGVVWELAQRDAGFPGMFNTLDLLL